MKIKLTVDIPDNECDDCGNTCPYLVYLTGEDNSGACNLFHKLIIDGAPCPECMAGRSQHNGAVI